MQLQLMALSIKHSLHLSILTTFWLGMLSILNATPYPNIVQDLPPDLQITVAQQLHLGWDQLYYGWFAKCWATAINNLHPDLASSG